MDSPDLKHLTKLIDLLRRKGVKTCEFHGIKLELWSDVPPSRYHRKNAEALVSSEEAIPQYSDEDMLLWSAGQLPPETQGDVDAKDNQS